MKSVFWTIAVLMAASSATVATEIQNVYSGEFPRLDFETVMPTGQCVAVECQDEAAGNPYTPNDWPQAAASLDIWQGGSASKVQVAVLGVRPDTLYTIWVRLRAQDSEGNPFGENPIIRVPGNLDAGIPGNALVSSTYLSRALDAVHIPVSDPLHGFWSDSD